MNWRQTLFGVMAIFSGIYKQGYPVKYTDVRGRTTTLYFKTVQEVAEFSDPPFVILNNMAS